MLGLAAEVTGHKMSRSTYDPTIDSESESDKEDVAQQSAKSADDQEKWEDEDDKFSRTK